MAAKRKKKSAVSKKKAATKPKAKAKTKVKAKAKAEATPKAKAVKTVKKKAGAAVSKATNPNSSLTVFVWGRNSQSQWYSVDQVHVEMLRSGQGGVAVEGTIDLAKGPCCEFTVKPGRYDLVATKGDHKTTIGAVNLRAGTVRTFHVPLEVVARKPSVALAVGDLESYVTNSSFQCLNAQTTLTPGGANCTINCSVDPFCTIIDVNTGTYSATATLTGYYPSTLNNVRISAAEVTTISFILNHI